MPFAASSSSSLSAPLLIQQYRNTGHELLLLLLSTQYQKLTSYQTASKTGLNKKAVDLKKVNQE